MACRLRAIGFGAMSLLDDADDDACRCPFHTFFYYYCYFILCVFANLGGSLLF